MTAALGTLLFLQAVGGGWDEAAPLPRPVTNNAVAALERAGESALVFSFMGLASGRAWSDVVSWTFRWDVSRRAWEEVAAVPGPGRLAATAQAVGGRLFVFGGYTVAADGSERSVSSVDVYDPVTDRWSAAAPMPVPVDDAVSGLWRDSLVYLVSGWHDGDNVRDVQIYDPAKDAWSAGTPIPGPPVFGHSGGLARDAIVYADGVRAQPRVSVPDGVSRYEIEPSAWRGDIDPADPTRIDWRRLPSHPGPAFYRAAAGVLGTRVVFVGGTDNPYNYDGTGYDGRPSAPVSLALSYDVVSGSWSHIRVPRVPTMDHRAAVRAGGYLLVVGGMEADQRVTNRVQKARVLSLLGG